MASVKDKIAAVRNVVKNTNNDEIVLVLQHHDYDVDKTISDFLEGRAVDILTEWKHTGPAKFNKSKKKKSAQRRKQAEAKKLADEKASKTETTKCVSPNGAPENPLPCNRDTSYEDRQDITVENPQVAAVALKHLLTNEIGSEHPESLKSNQTTSSSAIALVNGDADHHTSNGAAHQVSPAEHPEGENAFKPHLQTSNRSRSSSESSNKTKSQFRRKHKGPSNHSVTDNHENQHQHHQSNYTQPPSSAYSLHNKKSIEKASRDLQRCAVSFGRYRNLLNDEITDSYKRIKQVFEELTNALMDREVQLMRMLDEMKEEAFKLLDKREARAAELKKQTERVASMTQHQLNELRGEIKHFVAERKYDEELGRTTRFIYDREVLMKVIPGIGEISAVKNSYTSKPRERVESIASDISSSAPSVAEHATPSDHISHSSPAEEKSDLPLESPSWADSVDAHYLQETTASWPSDAPATLAKHQNHSKVATHDTEKSEHHAKPQRERYNRRTNHSRNKDVVAVNHSSGSDDKMMLSPPIDPTSLPEQLPESNNMKQNGDNPKRKDTTSRHDNYENQSNGDDDGSRRSPRGRYRGGYRWNYRGNPRGGYRGAPVERYNKSYQNRNYPHDATPNHYNRYDTNSHANPPPQRNRPRYPMRGNSHQGPRPQRDIYRQNRADHSSSNTSNETAQNQHSNSIRVGQPQLENSDQR